MPGAPLLEGWAWKEMFPRGVCVRVCVLSHVPGMHVIVDGLSSTILTAAHPAAMGGIVTKETCQTDSELKANRKKKPVRLMLLLNAAG